MNDQKTTETHFYRLWHGNDNNRSEIARFKANDIDSVINYIKESLLEPYNDVIDEFGEENNLYLSFNVCINCERMTEDDYENEDCEDCQVSEWLQIEQNDDIEADFKTICGTNDFYDLTRPKGEEKSTDWSPELKAAWEKDPQGGAEALIAKTVELHPELTEGVDSELLKRGRRALKGGGV